MTEWSKYSYSPYNFESSPDGNLTAKFLSDERQVTVNVDLKYGEEEIIDNYGWRFQKKSIWKGNQHIFTEVGIRFEKPEQNFVQEIGLSHNARELVVKANPLNRNFMDLPSFEPMGVHYLQDGNIGGLVTRIWNGHYPKEICVIRASGDNYEFAVTDDYYSYSIDIDPPVKKDNLVDTIPLRTNQWHSLENERRIEYEDIQIDISLDRVKNTIKLSQSKIYKGEKASASIEVPLTIDFGEALRLICKGSVDYRPLRELISIKANYNGLYVLPHEYTDPSDWNKEVLEQVDKFVELGFNDEIGLTVEEYRRSLALPEGGIVQPKNYKGRFDIPIVVDPRLSLSEVFRRWGIAEFVDTREIKNITPIPEGPYIAWTHYMRNYSNISAEKALTMFAMDEVASTLAEATSFYCYDPDYFMNRSIIAVGSIFGDVGIPFLGPFIGERGLGACSPKFSDQYWGVLSRGDEVVMLGVRT